MIFKLDEIEIELTQELLRTLNKFVQYDGQSESGGILLGGYIPLENKYVISIASEPCEKDKCGYSYFVRNKENAQNIINEYWKKSEGKINYLGEWHTHGCERPYPSPVDRKLLREIIQNKSNVWNDVFMIIVGRKNTLYIGITNIKSEGKIIKELQVGEALDACIFD